MTNKRKEFIEKKAKELRLSLGISSNGIADIFTQFNTKYYFIRFPLKETSFLGAALKKDGDPIIFTNSSLILSREIFTAAHEIGHIELGHLNGNDQILTDCEGSNNTDGEKEADHFASCLLMPREEISSYFRTLNNDSVTNQLDIAALQNTFHVSFESVLIRLNRLNLITDNDLKNLSEAKRKSGVANLLNAIGASSELCRSSKAQTIPIEFLQWVEFNYREKLIPKETLLKALNYVNLTPEDVGIYEQSSDTSEDDFDLDDFLLKNVGTEESSQDL